MKKWVPIVLLAVVLLGGGVVAEAVSLSIEPVSQTVAVGETVSVNLIIDGLETIDVANYDIDVLWDASILDWTMIEHYNNLGFGDFVLDTSNADLGIAKFFNVSFEPFLDFQADSFVIGTLKFNAIAEAIGSVIGFNLWDLGDLYGNPIAADQAFGTVTVVPEPASLFLVGTGLGAMLLLRRRVLT